MIASNDHDPTSVLNDALARARQLIDAAAPRSRDDRATRRRFQRLFQDPSAVGVTIALTDEVMRFRSVREASSALRTAVKNATRTGFGLFNLTGLRLVAGLSRAAPSLATRIVNFRIRALTENLILDAAPASLGEA